MRKTIKKVAAITFIAAFAGAAAVPASYIVPIGMTVSAEGEIEVHNEKELRAKLAEDLPTGTTIKLTGDIDLEEPDDPDDTSSSNDTSRIEITSPDALTIDLGGHKLYRSGGTSAPILFISGSGSLTLYHGKISGGRTVAHGGGISYNDSKDNNCTVDLTLDTIDLVDNQATSNTSDGGALYMKGGDLTLINTVVADNSAGRSGGGIYYSNSTGTFTVSGGCTIGSTDLTATSPSATGNRAKTYGAGLYINAKAFSITDKDEDPTNDHLYVQYNTLSGSGGGGAGMYAQVSDGLVLDSIVEIDHNTSLGMGGGIQSGGKLTVDGATISNNSATISGGGIQSEGALTIKGNTIITKNKSYNNGGGIYASGGATISDGTISENEAVNGAGMAATGNSAMTGGKISGNTASSNGGGVYIGGGSFNLEASADNSAKIIDNTAAYGGGIYVNGALPLNGKSPYISGNIATSNGGGIYAGGAIIFNIDGHHICDNTVGDHPDDLYIAGAPMTFQKTFAVSDNKIAVSMRSGSGAFTNGAGFDDGTAAEPNWAAHDPAKYFVSSDPNYKVGHKKKAPTDEAYLVPADATPVSLTDYAKVKFAWTKDGTKCYFYGLQNGEWKKIGNATISGNTATYGGHTSTKPGTVPTNASNAEVKVNFEKEDDAKNKLTLHMVCGSGSEDNIITVMGFEVTTVNASGAVVKTYDPLERTDVNALAGSYDVSVFVGAGKGVRVQPYYYIKAADDTAEGNGEKVMTDVYGTFYVTE